MKTINDKLAIIQTQFKSKKSRFNAFGKYYFRSAEDILEATKPFLIELGVTVTVKEKLLSTEPFPIMEMTATISDGENAIHANSIVGVDLEQKGMQMPQKFGSSSSYGKKYALGNLFLIDDTADSDASNTHDKSTPKKALVSDSDSFNKAKEYIKKGGSIDDIKGKYTLTKDVETKLTTL